MTSEDRQMLDSKNKSTTVRIVNHMRYDATKAEAVATNHVSSYEYETLRRTPGGVWWLEVYADSTSRRAPGEIPLTRVTPTPPEPKMQVRPLSPAKAQAWLAEHQVIEVLDQYFPGAYKEA